MSFQSVKGQTRAAGYLRTALEKNRLPHGLLFLGPQESGQREMTKELAKALFCVKKEGVEGCGECVSCHLVESGNHPDYRIFEPEEDSRVLKVEKIRELIGLSNFKPFQAKAKLFVVDRAESLNEISQNAFLKTLEEPAAHTYFVLICYAAEKLLSTIRSRAQVVHFHALPAANENLEELEKAKLVVWDRVAKGCLANSSAAPVYGVKAPDLSTLTREEASRALEYSIRSLRDTLLMRAGSEDLLGEIQDRLQKEKIARALSEEELVDRMETLAIAKEKIEHSVNLKLALSVLWEDL